MGIEFADVIIYTAFVLGFILLTIYLLNVYKEKNWIRVIPETLKIFGFFIVGSLFFLLVLSIPNILRGCIINPW